jgi:hypothetical protein
MRGCSIHNHRTLLLAVGVIGDIGLIYVLQPLEEYFLVMLGRGIEVHLNPRVIIRLFLV